MKCPHCGDIIEPLIGEEDGKLMCQCPTCESRWMAEPRPCPECGGVVLPLLLSVDERTNRPGLLCVKCGHEVTVKPEAVEQVNEGP